LRVDGVGMSKFSFEKLDVWQKAKDVTLDIYRITSSFPKSEKFGLVSQLRRASVSVSSNIAEGASRTTAKDQARFYTIAYSSSVEILNQLIICSELGFVKKEDYKNLRAEIEHITAMLNRLHKATQS